MIITTHVKNAVKGCKIVWHIDSDKDRISASYYVSGRVKKPKTYWTDTAKRKYLDQHAEKWIKRQQERQANKTERQATINKLKIGDVLKSSWGYEQTNIDYYQVTRLIGKTMVEIRELKQDRIYDDIDQGRCIPLVDEFDGEPMRKKVSSGGDSVKIASYAWAHLVEPQIVAGARVYKGDRWSAYH